MIAESQCSLTSFASGEKSLEVLVCAPHAWQQTIVLLHEALGSVSYWKDFPDRLAGATGCRVLAYSRAGHGNSQGPLEPRSAEYYRNQVEVVLPALLRHFDVQSPILYGHSEGAAIGLLYAAIEPQNVWALVAEAPIVTAEQRARDRIQELAATFPTSDLNRKLTRYHQDSEAVFHSWIAGVTTPQMLQFPLDRYLPRIVCPLLVLQGSQDEFGGSVQLQTIQKYLPHAQCEVIVDAGHLPHREKTEVVLDQVGKFLANISSTWQQEFVDFHPPYGVPE